MPIAIMSSRAVMRIIQIAGRSDRPLSPTDMRSPPTMISSSHLYRPVRLELAGNLLKTTGDRHGSLSG